MPSLRLPPVPEIPDHLQPPAPPGADPEFPLVRICLMLVALALLALVLAGVIHAPA